MCTHTDTEGKQGKARVRYILKNSEKNTIFNEHPVSLGRIDFYPQSNLIIIRTYLRTEMLSLEVVPKKKMLAKVELKS